MIEKKQTLRIIVAILTALMLISTVTLLAGAQINTTDYGDIMQYDWPHAGSDEGNTGYNAGPAPDVANVLWSVSGRGTSGMVCAFNGMLFTASGTTVYTTDPFTGALIYTSEAPGTPSITAVNGIHKLDDTYFLTIGGSGLTIRLISNGDLVWNATTPNANRQPGSGTYFGGHYSTSMKMFFNHAYDDVKHEAQIVAHDVSDPTKQPTIAWIYRADSASEILCSGDGKLFLGSTEGEVYALDINGNRIWESHTLGGIAQQSAMYMDGKLYISAVTWQMICFDGETGEMLWSTEKGVRAFSAYRGTVGMGIVFDTTVETDPYGAVRAFDVETGEQIWKQPAYFRISYTTMTCADGKVYTSTCDSAAGSVTAGLLMPGYETTCFDAYTGTQLWKLNGINFATPSIAYGNLYGISGGILYCIGGEPKDWNYGFLGNIENPRVAVGQQGPTNISTPRWEYQAGGDISSSPAVVDGKVYFGSADKNWYCLDAYTGEKIWNFTIGHYVRSSATVVNGRVFTGADDGYFYCLNAESGEQIWKTSAGGFFPYLLDVNEADLRSSPIVIGTKLYAGSLDGKVYCLSTSDGTVQHTYTTEGPIFGSPTYANGIVYIASGDAHLYALNAADLSFKWRSFPLNMSDIVNAAYCEFFSISTPTVAEGNVFIGGGVQYGTALYDRAHYAAENMSYPSMGGGIRYFAFDAATGESVWNVSRAGNTQPGFVAAYWNGLLYGGENFEVTAMNATNPRVGTYQTPDSTGRIPGNRVAGAWLGYQIQSSVAYADDLTGAKIYIGSDIGSLYCLNATDLSTLSVFTAGGNVVCSPAIWEAKMYIGTTEGIMYCFDDSPTVDFNLYAASNKGAVMWNNETITIGGRLTANPMELVWEDGVHTPYASNYHPGLPNVEVQLSLTKPDGTDQILTATTNQTGYFTFNYNPTTEGEWGWVVYYEGKRTASLTYNEAYGEWNPINVVAAPTATPTTQPTAAPTATLEPTVAPTAAPTEEPASGLAIEYIYAIIAVIVIVVVIVGVYFYTKRSK
ncbi:MAG: PQQ-binding-like beta-propeller repeat protein [Candidatus Bathyarchaeota archaeon]|nr:PQQ-binding-like beta-propeller repeat protein [Candidatus Bathyarchaeota archaeon]